MKSYLEGCHREPIKDKASLGCTDCPAMRSVRESGVQSAGSGEFFFFSVILLGPGVKKRRWGWGGEVGRDQRLWFGN